MQPRLLSAFLCLLVFPTSLFSAEPAADEQKIWELERAYWRYVENNDLKSYLDLWHADFVGWPSVSASPVRKDHITDWITSQTGKGLKFKAGEFKPAAIKVTGDVAFVCYWITLQWGDHAGGGTPGTYRITHAWLRTGQDWKILGGMSMPETAKQGG